MGPVVAIEYRRCLEDALRHAALKGVRPDKKPALNPTIAAREARAFWWTELDGAS